MFRYRLPVVTSAEPIGIDLQMATENNGSIELITTKNCFISYPNVAKLPHKSKSLSERNSFTFERFQMSRFNVLEMLLHL